MVTREHKCDVCNGLGTVERVELHTCPKCEGRGTVTQKLIVNTYGLAGDAYYYWVDVFKTENQILSMLYDAFGSEDPIEDWIECHEVEIEDLEAEEL